MTFNIITLGCKVNLYESEIMQEKLIRAGYILQEIDSDIVIINTCSVTNMADNKSKKIIRGVRRENESAILVVCGCMSENHRNELDSLDIDILIGNKDKSKIVELINEYLDKKEKIVRFYNDKIRTFEDMQVDSFQSHTRAFMKIQDGCNNYCAYCIIPYTRGNIRSKDFNKAIEEAKTLVNNGHKEIVLTGINTGSYGKECGSSLVSLIDEMSKIKKLERIRISSIEITEIDDKFLEMLQNNSKVCDHLHIPLQSGSAKILNLMGRKYTKELYLEIINKIRTIRKDINITTDVIVGFPGEDETDFLECVEFCKKIKFGKIHVFPYSKREGTKASLMTNQVDNGIKKERARNLIKVSEELEKNYNASFIGKKVEILVETIKDNKSTGLTSNYLKVVVDDILEVNETYQVVVMEVKDNYVKGSVINC